MDITIDCSEIHSREEFHRAVANSLKLPNYYGENLDALFDCLTSKTERTIITFENIQCLIDNLGSYGRAAINMVAAAERENTDNLTLNMR